MPKKSAYVDPLSGISYPQRGGLVWQPRQDPAQVVVSRAWQPNLVARQVPVTQYVARQVITKVPTQVCTYVDQEMVQRFQVQVCQMVTEEHVRRIPYQVCRQVCERVERHVPVQVCRMVRQEMVRRVPIRTCRMVCEERVERIPIRVCKMVTFKKTIQVPRTVTHRIPVTYTVNRPRTVVMRVPIDPCGAPACSSCAPASYIESAPAATYYDETDSASSEPATSDSQREGIAEGPPTLDADEKIDGEETIGILLCLKRKNVKIAGKK